MKLHLPHNLRKAVLSCLALSATLLPGTLATGSLFIAAASYAFPAALAADPEEEEEGEAQAIPSPESITWDTTLTLTASSDVSGFTGNVKVLTEGQAVTLTGAIPSTCTNLWLTSTRDSNCSNITTGTANILAGVSGTIYVDHVGLNINKAQSFSANLSLGTAYGTALTASGFVSSCALWIYNVNVTTTGNLEIRSTLPGEDVEVLSTNTFTVGELTGSGDLKYCDYNGRGFVLTHGGEDYTGTLTLLKANGSNTVLLKLGGNLNMRGLITGTSPVTIQALASDDVTLSIAGNNNETAGNVTFGDHVNLLLKDGASQSFVNSSLQGVELSSGSTLTLGASSISGALSAEAGSMLKVSGGTLDMSSEGFSVVSGSSLLLSLNIDSNANAMLKLSSSTSVESLSGWTLLLTGVDFSELTGDTTYRILTEDSTFTEDLTSLFDTSYLPRNISLSYENGQITLSAEEAIAVAHLSWSGASLVWQEGAPDTIWNSADELPEEQRYFRPGDHVEFNAKDIPSGMSVELKGTVRAGDMVVSGGRVDISGTGSLEAASLTIAKGATATFSDSGAKSFTNGVDVSGTLVISDFSGWSGTISGSGTLNLATGSTHDFSDTGLGANLPDGKTIGAMQLTNDTSLDIDTSNGGTISVFERIGDTIVEEGSAILIRGVGSDTGNSIWAANIGDQTHTITIEGEGQEIAGQATVENTKGAIVFAINSSVGSYTLNYNINSNLTLSDDAAIDVAGTSSSQQTTYVAGLGTAANAGVLNGNGHKLTKRGVGQLVLGEYFNTAKGSTGTLSIETGALVLHNTEHTDALKNYTIDLQENGSLDLNGGTYAINSLSGSGSVESSGTLKVGNEETSKSTGNTFSGSLGAATLEVVSGYQAVAFEYTGAYSNLLVSGTGTLDVSGLTRGNGATLHLTVSDSGTLVGVNLGAGDTIQVQDGVLTLAGNSNKLTLTEGMLNARNSLITFSGGSGAMLGTLQITLDGELLKSISEAVLSGTEQYLNLANVSITGWDISMDANLLALNLVLRKNEDGHLLFDKITPLDEGFIYTSSEGSHSEVTGEDVYESDIAVSGAVHVDKDLHINLSSGTMTTDDGLTLHNLVGSRGNLTVDGKGSGKSKITITNSLAKEDLRLVGEEIGIEIQDKLVFAGNVTLNGTDLQIKHQSQEDGLKTDSVTQINGKLTMNGGKLEMTGGILELTHRENDLGNVGTSFAGTDGQLVIRGGSASMGGTIELGDGTVNKLGEREHIKLEDNGLLILKKGAQVGAITIGDLDNRTSVGGTVSVAGNNAIDGAGRLKKVVLHLDGELSLYASPNVSALPPAPDAEDSHWLLAGLTGAGSLSTQAGALQNSLSGVQPLAAGDGSMDIGIQVGGQDRVFSGKLTKYVGTMTVYSSPFTQYFSGVSGSTTWNLVNAEGGRVAFELMAGKAPNNLTMGNLTLSENSYTTVSLNLAANGGITMQELDIQRGADVTIAQYEGTVRLKGDIGSTVRLASLKASNATIADGVRWHVRGVRNEVELSVGDDGAVYAKLLGNSKYTNYAADNANTATGAVLLDGLDETAGIGGDLMRADRAILDFIDTGRKAQADKALAAVAGAGLSVLGQALGSDMERQLRNLQNRVTSLGHAKESKEKSVWLNAETSFAQQKADRLLPGFKTNGWGGTVGVSFNQGSNTTVGFALAAMYNDLESDGADRLKGDMDTCYFSGFALISEGAWRHTFLCSLGRAEVSANRTVNYGTGSYKTSLSTEGMLFGAMYELGYSMMPSVEEKICLLPVFNITWHYNRLDAYREGGSNAALQVDEQSYSSLTLGAGLRVQAVVGEETLNHKSLLEARALLKVDTKDRQGEARVQLVQNSLVSGRVQSAERSAVGLEIGVGFNTPVTKQSDIFMDISADLRASLVEMNATLGYKVSF